MPLSDATARALISELRSARAELQVLRAVDATVQAFSLALNTEPPRRGASPDALWQAEVELQEPTTKPPKGGRVGP